MRPGLDIRHLEVIQALEAGDSLAAAAERLGVTASALSHRLSEAERRLDIALFVREGRRVQATPAGILIAREADTILGRLERAEADARALAGGAREVVRLGLGAYSVYHWLPSFLAHMRRVDDAIQVEIVAGVARRPETALLDATIDVALIAGRATRTGVETAPLFEDELVAIMAPSNPLAGRPYLEAGDFSGQDYFTYSRTPQPGHEYDRIFRDADVPPRRTVRVEQIAAIVELVKANLGLSILTRWAMEPHLRSGALVCRPLTPNGLTLPWLTAIRSDTPPQGAARRVAATLKDWVDRTPEGFRTMTPPEDSAAPSTASAAPPGA